MTIPSVLVRRVERAPDALLDRSSWPATVPSVAALLLENHPGGRDPDFHEMSHGESFLEILGRRLDGAGLFLLDEPESALSFTGCLALVGLIGEVAKRGNAQVVVATHSPLLAATPSARIIEVGEWGLRDVGWEDLALVQHWRSFLDAPERYLRHVL